MDLGQQICQEENWIERAQQVKEVVLLPACGFRAIVWVRRL